MISQLALNIPINEQKVLDNFNWSGNALLQKTIERVLLKQDEPFIFIFGPKGSGKSHLLQGLYQEQSKQAAGAYLPLEILREWGTESLSGMSEQAFLVLDDIDAISGDKTWEEAIFHLYNQFRDKNKGLLIISAQTPPQNLEIELLDLHSRLCSGLIMPIHPLEDEIKIQVLQTQAKARGIELSLSVSQFIMNRCERNLAQLSDILDKLDKASLAAQRKITVPFAKEILGL